MRRAHFGEAEKSPHAVRAEFGKVCTRLAFYCIKAKSLANQVQEIEVKLESFGRMASGEERLSEIRVVAKCLSKMVNKLRVAKQPRENSVCC